MAAPSYNDYFQAGRAEAINRRPDLTFDEGDISEFLVAAMGAMADHLTGYFAGRFQATYLDGASGDDLTTLADDHWNVQRFQALASGGNCSFSRPAPSLGTAPAGVLTAGTVVATQQDALGNQTQYTLDADLNWGTGDLGPKVAHVTCTATGIAGNSDVNKVSRITSSTFDSTISVSNPTDKMAGGADQESDDDLRERVRGLPATLRRGTLAAVEYGATTVAGVAKATAVEEFGTNNLQTGIVDLYIADAQGNSNSTMVNAVKAEEENWRPAGSILNVYGGALSTVDVIVAVVARLGTNTQALSANIIASVTARVNKLHIGETLSPDIIKQAVLNVDDSLLSVNVVAPSVPVAPGSGTLIRCGTVTVQ